MLQRIELKLFEDGAIVAARLAAGRAAATAGGAPAPREVAWRHGCCGCAVALRHRPSAHAAEEAAKK